MLVGVLSLLIVGAGTFGAFAYAQDDNIVNQASRVDPWRIS